MKEGQFKFLLQFQTYTHQHPICSLMNSNLQQFYLNKIKEKEALYVESTPIIYIHKDLLGIQMKKKLFTSVIDGIEYCKLKEEVKIIDKFSAHELARTIIASYQDQILCSYDK